MHIPNAHDVPWWAFVDGWVIPEQTETVHREGREQTVSVLAGTNANEGSVLLQDFPVTTQTEYRRYLNSNRAPCGTEMVEFYPAVSPAEIKTAVDHIITDALFLYGVHGVAQAEQGKGQRTYLYLFSRGSRDKKRASLGPWHGAEIPYVFGLADSYASPFRPARQRSEQMMDAWTNFARTGNPNSGALPRWPTATPQDENYMEFGDTTTVYRLMKKRNFAVFDRVFTVATRTVGH